MRPLISSRLITASILFLSYALPGFCSDKISVTTSPQTARIYVDGVQMGTGKVVVKVAKGACVTVEVKMEGYIQETRTYCDKKGVTDPPSSDYIQLQEDESYTSSIESNIANTEVQINVNPSKNKKKPGKRF